MNDYRRPTKIQIDLDALAQNYQALKSHCAPSVVMPVLKANAYGHGLVPCGKLMRDLGAEILGVACLDEAIALREADIATPLLCFGSFASSQAEGYLAYDVACTVPSLEKLRVMEDAAARMGKRAKVHLKIDTGMERIGTHYYSCEKLMRAAMESKWCEVEAVYSHLARSEEFEKQFTETQISRLLGVIEAHGFQGKKHIANTGGALAFAPDPRFDYVRAGLSLYGVLPDTLRASPIQLKPVMRLRSEVVYFKVVPPQVGVSYSHAWKADKQTRVVTVPIGYGDGYRRTLSNKGEVLIRGKRFPIIGNICMDQLMVAIGDEEAYNGDEVVLIGEQQGESIFPFDLSAAAQTDVRDILCSLNHRIPRIYTQTTSRIAFLAFSLPKNNS